MSKPVWNMLPAESPKAYQAFQDYLALGPDRSLERVHRESTAHPPLNSLKAWSTRHDWQARSRAFDEVAAAKAAALVLESAADVRARQAKHAKAIQLRAMQTIANADPKLVSVRDAIQAWKVGADAERKALGITEDHVLVLKREEVSPEEAARLLAELRRLEAIEGETRVLEDHEPA
jgi:hypothetical protein